MPLIMDYAQLDDLKSYVSVTTDTYDDELALIITAVSREIDGWCNRQFGRDDTPSTRVYWATNLLYIGIDDVAGITTDENFVTTNFSLNGNGSEWIVMCQPATSSPGGVIGDAVLTPYNAETRGRPYTQVTSLGRLFVPYPIGPLGQIFVTAQWGWASVPDVVSRACLIQASRIFKRKDAPFGIVGGNQFGGGATLRPGLDDDVRQLLSSVRKYRWRP